MGCKSDTFCAGFALSFGSDILDTVIQDVFGEIKDVFWEDFRGLFQIGIKFTSQHKSILFYKMYSPKNYRTEYKKYIPFTRKSGERDVFLFFTSLEILLITHKNKIKIKIEANM